MWHRSSAVEQQMQPVNGLRRGPSAQRGALPSATSHIRPVPPHPLDGLLASQGTSPRATAAVGGNTTNNKLARAPVPGATPDEMTPLNWSLHDSRTKPAQPLLTPDNDRLPSIAVAQFVPRPPAMLPVSTRAAVAQSVSCTPSPLAQSLDVRSRNANAAVLPPAPAPPTEKESEEFVSGYDVVPRGNSKAKPEGKASSAVEELRAETPCAASVEQSSATKRPPPPTALQPVSQPLVGQQLRDGMRSNSTTPTHGLSAIHSAFNFMQHTTTSSPRTGDYFSADGCSRASTEAATQSDSGSDADGEHAEEGDAVSLESRPHTRRASHTKAHRSRSHASRHRTQRAQHHATITKSLNPVPPARRTTASSHAEPRTPSKSASGRTTRRPSAVSSSAAVSAVKTDEALHATEEVRPKGRAAHTGASSRRGSHASQQLSQKPGEANTSFSPRSPFLEASTSLTHKFTNELSTSSVSGLTGPSVLKRTNNLATAQWISLTAATAKVAESAAVEAGALCGDATSVGPATPVRRPRRTSAQSRSSKKAKVPLEEASAGGPQATEEANLPVFEARRVDTGEASVNGVGDGSWADFWTSELSGNSFSKDGGHVGPAGGKVSEEDSSKNALLPLTPTPGTSTSLSGTVKQVDLKNDAFQLRHAQSPHRPATTQVGPCSGVDLDVAETASSNTYSRVPHPPQSPQSPSTASECQESLMRQRMLRQQQQQHQQQQLYWQHLHQQQRQQQYHQQFHGLPVAPSAPYAAQAYPPYRPQPPHPSAPTPYGRGKVPWPQPDIVFGPKCVGTRSRAVDFTALTGVRLSDAKEVPSPCWSTLEVSTVEHELVDNSEGWAPCPPAETE